MATLIAIIISSIVFVVVIGAIFVYDALAWGLVLYKFWAWFVLPVFVALPVLTFVQALGLMFVVGLFKSNYAGEGLADKYKKSKYQSTVLTLINPWFTLLFGWLAYSIWIV
jgi:hypothetical protein